MKTITDCETLLLEKGFREFSKNLVSHEHIVPPELVDMRVFSKKDDRRFPYLVWESGYGWYIEFVDLSDVDEKKIAGTTFIRDYHYSDRLYVLYFIPSQKSDDDGFTECLHILEKIYKKLGTED